jgi:kexin
MQYLVMDTAVPVDLETGEWQTTSIGKKFSHTFGYGKIDTYATIEAAKTFQNVKPQAWFYSPWMHIKQDIPQGDQGLAVSFEVTADMLKQANLERLEHVTVTMNVKHARRGDLSVDLVSPDKVTSHLSVPRRLDSSSLGYQDWTFMSVVHWGESGIGTWTVIVKDTVVNNHNGSFTDWKLKLWGEAIDADKATLLPMPNSTDDDDHDVTTTVSATTIAHTSAPTQTGAPAEANPTDHPDRPVNSKPSGTDDEVAKPTTTSPAAEAETSGASSATDNGWLPSFFPTFGVSARTQVWIYGALALIVIFCSGLAVYFWMARRKRLRNNPRDEYEFDLIDEDEAEGLTGAGGAKGGKRRAGELYDAFAAGTDEEFSDDESVTGEGYKDISGERHVIGDDDDEVEDEKKGLVEKSG